MFDYDDFEDVFGPGEKIDYDAKTVKKIRENRAALEGELFVDKLLKALGLSKVHKSYPPSTHHDLRSLHTDITNTPSPDHHKTSVLYYLVKDLLPKHSSHEQIPHHSANGSHLPPKYKTFIDGIWLLDRLRFEKALDYLTEPALTPTFPDEILYTLCKHASSSAAAAAADGDVSLPIAYYQAVSPPLASSLVQEAYFLFLCRTSVTEAFFFSRAQGAVKHKMLFQKMIEAVLEQAAGEEKASQGVELVYLPLDEIEEMWLRERLKGANQSKLRGAADTLVMRDVVMGRVEGVGETVALTGGRKIEGVSWGSLLRVLQGAGG